MPSVALLRHFFSLRIDGEHTSACADFVAYSKANTISKTGKRVNGFRSKWVMMDARCIHSRLVLPTEPAQPDEAWSRMKLDDRRAKLMPEKMNADLRPGNMKAAKLTGATLLREFLT